MLKVVRTCAVAAVLSLIGATVYASPIATVVAPGPLNSTSIVLHITNTGTTDLLSILFDLTPTVSSVPGESLVIDPPPFSEVGPSGGTAVFNLIDTSHFGYTFTGFNPGETFEFAWDPDIATNAGYGAIVGEQAGMLITVAAGGGLTGTGVLAVSGEQLSVRIESVPEPSLVLLLASGLGFAIRRRQA